MRHRLWEAQSLVELRTGKPVESHVREAALTERAADVNPPAAFIPHTKPSSVLCRASASPSQPLRWNRISRRTCTHLPPPASPGTHNHQPSFPEIRGSQKPSVLPTCLLSQVFKGHSRGYLKSTLSSPPAPRSLRPQLPQYEGRAEVQGVELDPEPRRAPITHQTVPSSAVQGDTASFHRARAQLSLGHRCRAAPLQ